MQSIKYHTPYSLHRLIELSSAQCAPQVLELMSGALGSHTTGRQIDTCGFGIHNVTHTHTLYSHSIRCLFRRSRPLFDQFKSEHQIGWHAKTECKHKTRISHLLLLLFVAAVDVVVTAASLIRSGVALHFFLRIFFLFRFAPELFIVSIAV